MKYFWKVNVYEIQVLLYWILGNLILNFGTWHWLGWLSIGYGWLTFVYCILFAIIHAKQLKAEFTDPN